YSSTRKGPFSTLCVAGFGDAPSSLAEGEPVLPVFFFASPSGCETSWARTTPASSAARAAHAAKPFRFTIEAPALVETVNAQALPPAAAAREHLVYTRPACRVPEGATFLRGKETPAKWSTGGPAARGLSVPATAAPTTPAPPGCWNRLAAPRAGSP